MMLWIAVALVATMLVFPEAWATAFVRTYRWVTGRLP